MTIFNQSKTHEKTTKPICQYYLWCTRMLQKNMASSKKTVVVVV
jgi:hypothetical protein